METKSPTTPLNNILQTGSQRLQNLIVRSKQLADLNSLLRTEIGQPLAQHCHIANLRDNCLVIGVSSAACATVLRYQSFDLLQKLRQHTTFAALANIKIKVTPTEIAPPKLTLEKPKVNAGDADILFETAQTYAADDPLAKVLNKLGNTLKLKSKQSQSS